jgi:hypothetical protein
MPDKEMWRLVHGVEESIRTTAGTPHRLTNLSSLICSRSETKAEPTKEKINLEYMGIQMGFGLGSGVIYPAQLGYWISLPSPTQPIGLGSGGYPAGTHTQRSHYLLLRTTVFKPRILRGCAKSLAIKG